MNDDIKYIIFGVTFQPATVMWNEVIHDKNLTHFDYPFKIKHITGFYNRLNIRSRVYKYLLKELPSTYDDKVIFIYRNPWPAFMAENGIVRFLRKQYPQSMHVALFGDVHAARAVNMEYLKAQYDSISIYDEEEAKNLGIDYFPAFYSKNFETPDERDEIYDLSFAGQAKNRLSEIIKVYEWAMGLGLKCNFYIVGAKKSQQAYADDIHYSDVFIDEHTYFEQYIKSSKCLLELTLYQTHAITARVREAIVYDKKVLSNNEMIAYYPFYNPNMMKIYRDINEVQRDFFYTSKVSYGYHGEFSPRTYLQELERQFYSIRKER